MKTVPARSWWGYAALITLVGGPAALAAQQQARVATAVTKVAETTKLNSSTLRCALGTAPPGYNVGESGRNPFASGCFTVRPREMATATRNEQAGEFTLDSLDDFVVYVPPQCVGPHRCPLLVNLPGGGFTGSTALPWHRSSADKTGLILLEATSVDRWWAESNQGEDLKNVDAAIKQVLRRFAIDPDKIALAGRCAGGPNSMIWGGDNLDLFSRVLPLSAGYPPTAGVDTTNKTTEIFLDEGMMESAGNFQAARELHQAGHPVKQVITLRGHAGSTENEDFTERWLAESWAKPNPADRRAPTVLAGPVPLLTAAMVRQLTTFWTSFLQEPASISDTARQAHVREVAVTIGDQQPSFVMTDMLALAAQFPSVAAALKQAGLTAEQHEAYRVALASALVADNVGAAAGPIESTSALAKNLEFVRAHADELAALEQTKIWETP